jgi:MFS family permease
MGGWLSQRFGGKRVFGYGVLCTSVLSMFSPVVVNASVWLLVALRILEGIGEGVTFSAMHSLLGQWAPPLERSVLSTFAYSGVFAGTVVALPISGVLSGTLGWPSVFYFFGGIGIVWWISWCVLVYDKPSVHPRISKKEREYIEEVTAYDKRPRAVPPSLWLTFLRSGPVWAIAVAHVCNNFGLYTLLITLPTFFDGVYEFDIKSVTLNLLLCLYA